MQNECFLVFFKFLLPLHLVRVSTVRAEVGVGKHSAISSPKFWERISSASESDCRCVCLVFKRSALRSIRRSLVPLNH